jgi:hypothetical protein
MSSTVNYDQGQIQRVYTLLRCKPVAFLLTVLAWTVGFAIILTILLSAVPIHADSRIDPKVIISWVAAILLSVWLNLRVRLVVYDNGLELRGAFDDLVGTLKPHLFSTWDNLSRFEVVETGNSEDGYSYSCVLYLKHAIGRHRSINIGQIVPVPFRKVKTGRWFSRQTYRVVDADKLVQSDFGQDLLQYAPHVIEAAQQEQARVESLVAQP